MALVGKKNGTVRSKVLIPWEDPLYEFVYFLKILPYISNNIKCVVCIPTYSFTCLFTQTNFRQINMFHI